MTEGQVLKAAGHFITRLEDIARDLGKPKPGITVAQAEKDAKNAVQDAFLELIKTIDSYAVRNTGKAEELKSKCRAILGPWLFRSDYFNRSFYKPHGYAGDYRLIEWIYALKTSLCDDPTKPAIVNCLDYVFSQLSSVKSAWERREYFAELMQQEYKNFSAQPQPARLFRILDVACGSSRYTSDFILGVADPSNIEVTLVDQDPTALEFCRTQSLSGRSSPGRLKRHCFPVKDLPTKIPAGEFDVVVSAGLFDYLSDDIAARLLAHMIQLTSPDGVTAVANFHPDDPAKTVLAWLVDWVLIYRTEDELSKLFPPAVTVEEKKKSGEIAYARARRPASPNPPKTATGPT